MAALGILECDVLYDDLIGDYVSYGVMLSELLASIDPNLNFTFYQIHDGELPSAGECDAYLLTGSKTGVYDTD
ncbi:MAG: GMP synthase, partial [Pseudomonadota bacterium]|nr:GMP synthase [Pseudomonadota bacterium]